MLRTKRIYTAGVPRHSSQRSCLAAFSDLVSWRRKILAAFEPTFPVGLVELGTDVVSAHVLETYRRLGIVPLWNIEPRQG